MLRTYRQYGRPDTGRAVLVRDCGYCEFVAAHVAPGQPGYVTFVEDVETNEIRRVDVLECRGVKSMVACVLVTRQAVESQLVANGLPEAAS